MKKQALLILGLMVLGIAVPTAALADWTEDQKDIWTAPATPETMPSEDEEAFDRENCMGLAYYARARSNYQEALLIESRCQRGENPYPNPYPEQELEQEQESGQYSQ